MQYIGIEKRTYRTISFSATTYYLANGIFIELDKREVVLYERWYHNLISIFDYFSFHIQREDALKVTSRQDFLLLLVDSSPHLRGLTKRGVAILHNSWSYVFVLNRESH